MFCDIGCHNSAAVIRKLQIKAGILSPGDLNDYTENVVTGRVYLFEEKRRSFYYKTWLIMARVCLL